MILLGLLLTLATNRGLSTHFGEELMVRLPEAEIDAVKKQGGRDFEPMAGHKMGGYVIVPGNWRAKPPTALIKRALEVTRKMPAKTPKKKAAAKR